MPEKNDFFTTTPIQKCCCFAMVIVNTLTFLATIVLKEILLLYFELRELREMREYKVN